MGCGLLPMPHVFTPVIMASGRVGGTKSLKSGKVGDTVLGIVQESNGSYSQKVSAYVPVKPQTQTVKLAVQQMCTAMVQAMMRDLKPLAKVAFQSAANKSKSLNAFSSFNLLKVAREVKDYWNETHDFEFAEKGERLKVGGRWMLSSGTLNYNCFSGYFAQSFADSWIEPNVRYSWAMFGVFFLFPDDVTTIGQFMARLKLTYSTEIWVAMYLTNQDETAEGKYCWCQIKLNPQVRQTDPATEESISDLFTLTFNEYGVKGWCRPTQYMWRLKHALCIGFRIDGEATSYVATFGKAFTITYVNGRKQISSSTLDFISKDHEAEWGYWRYPAQCVSSWTNPRIPFPVPYPY